MEKRSGYSKLLEKNTDPVLPKNTPTPHRSTAVHRSRLSRLVTRIEKCSLCIEQPVDATLPHQPRPVVRVGADARILIAAQAPGTRVHKSGMPFTDPSGDRLRSWLGVNSGIFYDTRKIAFVPMGFCFPGLDAKGGDLPPRRECAPAWRTQLLEELPNIQLILTIGLYAQKWHLGDRRYKTLTETVKAWREFVGPGARPKILPLPHPSWRNNGWLKRNAWFQQDTVPFLQAEVARLLNG